MEFKNMSPENQEIAKKVVKYAFDNQLKFAATELLEHFEVDNGCIIPDEIDEYLKNTIGEVTVSKIYIDIYNNIF